MNLLRIYLVQIIRLFNSLPAGKKITLILVCGLTVGGFYFLIKSARSANYGVLYGNLSPEDTGAIVEQLKSSGVPYILEGVGTIKVPSNKIYEVRISLATQDLPQGGVVGFEIFDKTTFGMTDFVQKLNYLRALQGELARTIMQLKEIETARVHIAIPDKSFFANEEKSPSASIIVKLRRGESLSKNQINGIIRLVAHSVESLAPENVTLVDSVGNLLSQTAKDETSNITDVQFNYRRKFEEALEKRIESMLEKTVGKDHVVARVSATFDFQQVETTEESFDPDQLVKRSEKETIQIITPPAKNDEGVLSSGSNILATSNKQTNPTTNQVNSGTTQTNPASSQTAQSSTASPQIDQKTDKMINYEVSKKVSKTISPVGLIKSLSVAVLVDGRYEIVTDKTPQNITKKYIARTPEEMTTFESIVKTAIGFSEERNDQVTVANVAFEPDSETLGDNEISKIKKYDQILNYAKIALLLFGIVLIFFLYVRPLIRSINESTKILVLREQQRELLENGGSRMLRADGVPGALPDGETLALMAPEIADKKFKKNDYLNKILDKQISDTIAQDSEKTARIIKSWMEEKQ